MPDTTRTFLALALPSAISPKLERLQSRLEQDLHQGRLSTPRPWHITLAFLGDVPHIDLLAVCRTTEEVAARNPRLALKLQGVGAFPDATRPRVIWAGLADPGLEALMKLQSELAKSLASLGFPGDHRPYHPHLTLGRLNPKRGTNSDISRILTRFAAWSAGPITFAEVVVFSSTLSPDGPEYAPLGRGRLAGKGSQN
jgi:RNA 2',3'-cyclic 3'-phosphodiesterase